MTLSKAFVVSLIFAALFQLLAHFDLVSKLPGLSCEGFGCMGSGILYAFIGVFVTPAVLFVTTLIFAKQQRWLTAFYAAIICFGVMATSIWIHVQIQRAEYLDAAPTNR